MIFIKCDPRDPACGAAIFIKKNALKRASDHVISMQRRSETSAKGVTDFQKTERLVFRKLLGGGFLETTRAVFWKRNEWFRFWEIHSLSHK